MKPSVEDSMCHYQWLDKRLEDLTVEELRTALCISIDVIDYLEEKMTTFHSETRGVVHNFHKGKLKLGDL